MDVVSNCPLRVASIVWRPGPQSWALTVVCKATVQLDPGESRLAQIQDDPAAEDSHWDDDEARSLSSASDLVPFKERADVLLVGHAFAPGRQPARCVPIRFAAGGVDKRALVWCDRIFWQDGRLLEGQPFTRMPLRYERAAGGPGTSNPVGMRFDAPPDARGSVPIPNLQPAGVEISRRGDRFAPVGFGPVAPSWPERAALLRGRSPAWLKHGWSAAPMPGDVDPACFNVAPRDQQVKALPPGGTLLLENLDSEHPRLETRLPDLRPRAVLAGGSRGAEEVALVADTLCIDTDRALAVVVWRGRVALSHPAEAGRVVVSLESAAGAPRPSSFPPGPASASVSQKPGVAPPPAEKAAGATGPLAGGQGATGPLAGGQGAQLLPFDPSEDFGTVPIVVQQRGAPTMPFVSAPAPSPEVPVAMQRAATVPFPPAQGSGVAAAAQRAATMPFLPAQGPETAVVQRAATVPSFPALSSEETTAQQRATVASFAALSPEALGGAQRGPTMPFFQALSPEALVTPKEPPPEPALLAPPPQPALLVPLPPEPTPPAPRPEPVLLAPLPPPELTKPEVTKPEPAPPPAPPAPAAEPRPADLSIEQCAAVAASIARAPADTAGILETHGLDPAGWAALEKRWADAIRSETTKGKKALLSAYDEAYVGQIERERGPIQAEEYARLVVAAERASLPEALAELSLPREAMMRVERVWLRRTSRDPALAASVKRAVRAAREA